MPTPKLIEVPYDGGLAWSRALAGHEGGARRLLRGFAKQVQDQLEPVLGGWSGPALWAFKKAVRATHAALGGTFVEEFGDVADAIGADVDELLVANLAYDLANCAGCSTFVLDRAGPPLHARNLDWPFPGNVLRNQTAVFHTVGAPCGDYAMVGWPGFVGALTGVATGRFSVTVNYVDHAEESAPRAALRRVFAGHWPVPWVVRKALDACASFDEAVSVLSETPLLAPVLFTVAGPKRGQALAIERGPSDYVHRRARSGFVRTTNHYVTPAYAADNCDLGDSEERYERLGEQLAGSKSVTPDEALDVLADDVLMNDMTQHQVVMCSATGALVVSVPGGERLDVEVSDRQYSVECPVSDESVDVAAESGTYVCPDCEGDISVDDGEVAHAAMRFVTCPESGARIGFPTDAEDRCCPDCGASVAVVNGRARHER